MVVLVLAVLAAPAARASSTWIVDSLGGGDFVAIQQAIDAPVVLPGDTLVVMPGTYIEDVLVHKSLTILGSPGMVLHPATSVPVNNQCGQGSQVPCATQMMLVQADDVTLSGLILDGDNPGLPNNPDARNGIITDYTTGTWNNLTVTGCTVRDVYLRGIYASNGTGHVFQGNTVDNVNSWSLQSAGVFLYGAQGTLSNNTVTNCSIGVGLHGGSQGSATGNTITGGDLGILVNGNAGPVALSNNTTTGSEQGAQAIAANAAVTITNCIFDQGKWGVTVFGGGAAGTVLIDSCTLTGAQLGGGSGIFVTTDMSPWGFEDTAVTVRRTLVRDFDIGIDLEENPSGPTQTLGITIGNDWPDFCRIFGNLTYGLFLQDCDDDVPAGMNYWGTNDPAVVETMIWHQVDDPALGLVTFQPINFLAPTLLLSGPPKIGTTVNLDFSGGFAGDELLFWPGLSVVSVPVPPFFGLLRTIPILLAGPVVLGQGGTYSLPLAIPNNPQLVGLSLYWQGLMGPDLSLGIGGFTNLLTMTFQS